MKTLSISTEAARTRRPWILMDAHGQVLGRLASVVASWLRGKHDAYYTPHAPVGAFVVVINARHLRLKGRKMEQKRYRYHTGWVGGLRECSAEQMFDKRPTTPLQLAVRGMLPKTTMGRQMLSQLKVYADAEHPHLAQRPTLLTPQGGR